jgi:hypothetical protein
MGGVPQAVYGDPRELMRVPDEIIESVVYLAFQESGDDESQIRLIGTGFFLTIWSARYFVPVRELV